MKPIFWMIFFLFMEGFCAPQQDPQENGDPPTRVMSVNPAERSLQGTQAVLQPLGPTSLLEASNGHTRQIHPPHSAVAGDDSEGSWENASSIAEETDQDASSETRRSPQHTRRASDRVSLPRETSVEEPFHLARFYGHGPLAELSDFLDDGLLPVRRGLRDQNDLAGDQEDPELEDPQSSQVSGSEQEDSHASEEEWEDVEEEVAGEVGDTEDEDTSSTDTDLRELMEEFHRDQDRSLDPESRFEETVTVNGEKICADVVKYTDDGEPYLPGSPLASTIGESGAASFSEEGASDPEIDLPTFRRLVNLGLVDIDEITESESDDESEGQDLSTLEEFLDLERLANQED